MTNEKHEIVRLNEARSHVFGSSMEITAGHLSSDELTNLISSISEIVLIERPEVICPKGASKCGRAFRIVIGGWQRRKQEAR